MLSCSNLLGQVFMLSFLAIFARGQKGADASSASLIFNSQDVVVNPNERLDLHCGVDGEYRACIWEKVGSDQSLQVEDVHQGRIPGISKPQITKGNECGIVIKSVDPSKHGQWTCKVFVVAKTLRGSKNVIVTLKPSPPSLDVSAGTLVVAENQDVEVSCTVAAARPPVRFRWYAASDDITGHSKQENVPTDDQGTYRSVSILKYKFSHKFNRHMLRCSIEHFTLDEPLFSQIPLDVRFHPYSISQTEFYRVPLEDSEYEIKFNLTSNPQPDARWIVGEDEIVVPGEIGRYQTRIVPVMENIYMIGLKIHEFTPQDVANSYKLIVSNEAGERNFDISLSNGPAPPDTMGTGALVAIVIIVVFILLLLFIIGIMRYRQMYCFGQRDKVKDHMKTSGETLKEEHSDTESAREPISSKPSAASPFKNIRMKFKRKEQKENKLENIEEGDASLDASKEEREGNIRGGGAHDNKSQVTED